MSECVAYLNHFNIPGRLKQACELGAVDSEGKITHEQFEVRRERARSIVGAKNPLFLVEFGGNRDVSGEARGFGRGDERGD